MPLSFIRTTLLLLGVLGLLTATVLDGIMMRHVMQAMLRFVEQRAPQKPVRYPPFIRFMLEHGWARRLYHLLFAVSALSFWWYLGTPAGAVAFARMK